jgi:hypothetical protein
VREQPVRVDLDDEFQLSTFQAGGVRHRERAGLVGARDGDVHVLPRKEPELRWLHQAQYQVAQVVGDAGDRDDLGHRLLDRQPRTDHVLVIVDQFDPHVLVHMRAAQQGEALLALVVGQRERRVPVEFDVVAVEHEGLAGRALALLAAVHEHDSLLGRGPQDRLVLVDLDLDADRLEPHHMLVRHDCLPGRTWSPSTGGEGPRGDPPSQVSAGAGRPAGPPRT